MPQEKYFDAKIKFDGIFYFFGRYSNNDLKNKIELFANKIWDEGKGLNIKYLEKFFTSLSVYYGERKFIELIEKMHE